MNKKVNRNVNKKFDKRINKNVNKKVYQKVNKKVNQKKVNQKVIKKAIKLSLLGHIVRLPQPCQIAAVNWLCTAIVYSIEQEQYLPSWWWWSSASRGAAGWCSRREPPSRTEQGIPSKQLFNNRLVIKYTKLKEKNCRK